MGVKTLLPVAIIAAALVGSYVVQPAETAVDVRVVGASALTVKVVKGRDDLVARGDTGSDGRVRLAVDPGRYRVGADAPRPRTRVRAVRVNVAEDEVEEVVLRVERRR